MKTTVRIFYNTVALYVKMFVTTAISLYLTRVVLNALGTDDFGLYSLIGGVIVLLSFLNSALMISTQRYLSVAMGEDELQKVKNIYTSSVIIHWGFCVILVIILEFCSLFLFDGFLNIQVSRMDAAKIVYQLMVFSTVITVIGVPYNSVINANEDLWYFAVVETITAIFKIGILVVFYFSIGDALITYTLWMFIVSVLNFLLKYIWCKKKYQECKLNIYSWSSNKKTIKEMLSFTGWNAFGSLALIGRNQGVAVLLNIFWGTGINAVYGIANQVNGQLIYFSTMMTTSMAPQIMKSKGEGNNSRMLKLSFLTSKTAFFLSAIFAIPLLIEFPFVLKLWLKTVPDYVEVYCSLMVFMFLVMQLYPGITRAIQACGKIKWYQILTSVFLLLPIPCGVLLYKMGYPNYAVVYAMIVSQVLQMVIAVVLAKKLVKLDSTLFVLYVLKSIAIFSLVLFLGHILHSALIIYYGDIVTFFTVVFVTMLLFSVLYFFFVFNDEERTKLVETIKDIICRGN